MSFRKKNKSYKYTVMIKRAIEVDDNLREWIFLNSNYRRKVWNDFVQEYYRCSEAGIKFDPMEFKKWYYNNIEVPTNVYDTYTIGISEQVMKDIIDALRICRIQNGTLKFHKFDRFKSSFKVHCKPHFKDSGRYVSRVHIFHEGFSFSNKRGDLLYFKLKEPIFQHVIPVNDYYYYTCNDYAFSEEDIKEISFIHELGRFYVCMSVSVINTYTRKNDTITRKNNAGIDLGIRNPICISDCDNNYVLRMSAKALSRINYLDKRIRRLQTVLNRKQVGSNNYFKVLKKIRISFYKMRNIRLNWRRKISKKIVLRYKNICVDTYRIPGKDAHVHMQQRFVKNLNYYNRLYGMSYFFKVLKHAANHYHTRYVDSPNSTTSTCSRCGFVNQKLQLSQRTMVCERCGLHMDRDANASMNCYNYLLQTV